MNEPRPLGPAGAFLLAIVFAGGCLVIGISIDLEPSPEGFGTHRQLGLASCGFRASTGIPCPTCGMTTSFAHSARLDFTRALEVQPFGTLLFLGIATATLLALYHLLARSYPGWLERLSWRTLLVAGLVLLLASWTWKIVESGSAPADSSSAHSPSESKMRM